MIPVGRLELVAVAGLAMLSANAPALDLTAGAGAAHNCPDSAYGIAFDAAAIAYLEPAPVVTVDNYGDGRYAPSRGNNIGVGIAYSELTGEVAGYCMGVLYRGEYRATASKDLLDILVANHFGHPFDAGRKYSLSMTEESFKAGGLRVRRVADFDFTNQWSVRFGLGASLLKATEGQEQTLSGMATATSDTYAVGTATWLQAASNFNLANFNPYVVPGNPTGDGFSTDAEFVAESKDGSSVDLAIIDALGRIYWRDVPRSLRTLNNKAVSYNANFDRDAFINGLDSRVSYVQDLAPKYHLVLMTPLVRQMSAFVEDDLVDGYHFPSAGARCGTNDRLAEISYDFRTKAIGIGAKLGFISASVTTNDVRLGNASVLGISIQGLHSW